MNILKSIIKILNRYSAQFLADYEVAEKVNKTRQTFRKDERLCSIKLTSVLFESGHIFHTSLFKIVWMYSPVALPSPAQVSFSVSKRSFKLAVSRNLARRRIREAYRKKKSFLYEHLESIDKQIVFTIILKGVSIPDYSSVEKGINGVILKLTELTNTGQLKC